MKITWFRHHHENRNDLLRFGLMRLHKAGEIQYRELPFSLIANYGFSKAIAQQKDPRHISFLLVEKGNIKQRCLVDSEDSFALITPLIAEVDLVFCSGYNADFFEHKTFVQHYSWQTESDLAWYRETLEKKIKSFGSHFHKVRRFVPIGPNQAGVTLSKPLHQKLKNITNRFRVFSRLGNDFADVLYAFEKRENYINSLRNRPLTYDVVLHDSLWGWPQHRINLHRQLKDLANKGHQIHSVLNWTNPVLEDGSLNMNLNQADFPLTTAPFTQPYEEMLAGSRLAVFATGFHWGWRNIMMLALKAGVPVLTDRLLTEPYFDMCEFKIFQQEDNKWQGIEAVLKSITAEQWCLYKKHNQVVYDKYMSPEAVARYFITTTMEIKSAPPKLALNQTI